MTKNKRKEQMHLDYYFKQMDNQELLRGCWGLCREARCGMIDYDTLELFHPTEEDREWLAWEGHALGYWGSGSKDEKLGEFTPLRQTIVLFMAFIRDDET